MPLSDNKKPVGVGGLGLGVWSWVGGPPPQDNDMRMTPKGRPGFQPRSAKNLGTCSWA